MNRRQIYNLFNGHCAYCGRKLDFDDMTLDHIHPQSKGGKDTLDNLYPTCSLCNNQKGSMSIEEFRSYIENISNELDDYKPYRLALKFNKITIKQHKIKFYFETVNI